MASSFARVQCLCVGASLWFCLVWIFCFCCCNSCPTLFGDFLAWDASGSTVLHNVIFILSGAGLCEAALIVHVISPSVYMCSGAS